MAGETAERGRCSEAKTAMTDHNLSLRLVGLSDYRAVRDGRAIGRIRLADERSEALTWEWSINPPLPIPSWAKGTAATLQEAKTAFQEAWRRFSMRRSHPLISSGGTATRTVREGGKIKNRAHPAMSRVADSFA